MTQEVADALGVDPAITHQFHVLVNTDVEQVRQQANVLAQGQGTGLLGVGPRVVIQMAAGGIACRT